MQIKYVGTKTGGENAFKDVTRITWYPGDENEVEPGVGEQMLKHPDVFVLVGSDQARAAEANGVHGGPGTWQQRGAELGLKDGNIEAIEAHGGPTTAHGARLWKEYTGTDFAPPVSLANAVKQVSRGGAVDDQDVDDAATAAEKAKTSDPLKVVDGAVTINGDVVITGEALKQSETAADSAAAAKTTKAPATAKKPAAKTAAKTAKAKK